MEFQRRGYHLEDPPPTPASRTSLHSRIQRRASSAQCNVCSGWGWTFTGSCQQRCCFSVTLILSFFQVLHVAYNCLMFFWMFLLVEKYASNNWEKLHILKQPCLQKVTLEVALTEICIKELISKLRRKKKAKQLKGEFYSVVMKINVAISLFSQYKEEYTLSKQSILQSPRFHFQVSAKAATTCEQMSHIL